MFARSTIPGISRASTSGTSNQYGSHAFLFLIINTKNIALRESIGNELTYMFFNVTKTKHGMTLTKIMLMLLLGLCYPIFCSAASASGKANQIITLSIKDASSTGNNIYNDLLSGKMYAVSYTWKSSNESVTQWSNKANTYAYVKFTKAGNYTVSYDLKYSFTGASRSYNFSCTWNVTITEDGPTSISVSVDKYSIEIGETTTARATLYGGSGSVTWSKGNSSNITLTPSGTTCQIKGINKGSATVTATTNNGRTDYVTITVKEPTPIPNTIKLSASKIEILEGESRSITATITGDNSNVCKWSCSNTSILSLSANGKTANITALKAGTTTIYATAYDGTKASCSVTVKVDPSKEIKDWCISGSFNGWYNTKMNSIGDGIFVAEIERLTPQFKFKPADSWNNNLGATDRTPIKIGSTYTLTEYGDNLIFSESVTAIKNAHITLNVPKKTVIITGTAVTAQPQVSFSEVNCKWGSTRSQVISTQEGGYKICQDNESIVIFTKNTENINEIYLAYKFDKDGKLCASTLSMPENIDSKRISDEFFAQYDSEITLEDGLEVKTDDTNLVAVDISSTINGSGNIITIGFSYYEPLEERDDCVDLGLSVRWATMNLGARKPTGVGGFYAFSETSTKSEYWRENYSFCNNNSNQYIFVYTNPQTNICGTKYDVATKQLGDGWKMPSLAEANELISKCTWEKETIDGIQVYRVTGPNGNSIVIPIVGLKKLSKDYSTSLLRLGIGECPSKSSEYTYVLSGQTNKGVIGQEWKAWGYNIRPVYTK